jgi:dipeptidyl-peptidase-4
MAVLALDPATGGTRTLREDRDPVWLDIVPGVPAWTNDGRLVTTASVDDTCRLLVDGEPVTPAGLHVRSVANVADGVLFAASDDATEEHVWLLSPNGSLERLTEAPGVHSAAIGGEVLVLTTATMERSGSFTILRRRGGGEVGPIASFAEQPSVEPRVTFLAAGPRDVRTALLLPAGYAVGDGPLPVLMDPYGGPHHARVTKVRDAYLQSQWFADQGFAVVIADGRGTPGRGAAWDRAVHLDLAGPPLEDQVDALHGMAEANPGVLDLARVGIRGWSFGGFLAALAVLRRPDVFHAAVAGAPVTDWRLYDTHYTERYLGTPASAPVAYDRSSLLADAANLERPLMLIHGLADDNVVAAHTLRLSSALLAAGEPHTVLPLSGVTHMTPQEVVAENLLLLQVAFLRQALGMAEPTGAPPASR